MILSPCQGKATYPRQTCLASLPAHGSMHIVNTKILRLSSSERRKEQKFNVIGLKCDTNSIVIGAFYPQWNFS